jgi:hypothetical protein
MATPAAAAAEEGAETAPAEEPPRELLQYDKAKTRKAVRDLNTNLPVKNPVVFFPERLGSE